MIEIADTAEVNDRGNIQDRAKVLDRAGVLGLARVTDNAEISGTARVTMWAKVSGRCRVRGHAYVGDHATVSGAADIRDNSQVYDSATISDHAVLVGHTRVYDEAQVSEWARLDDCVVTGNAKISGHVAIRNAHIGIDADVFRGDQVITLDGLFPDRITVYRTKDGSARVQAGCQNFPLTESQTFMTELAAEHGWDLPFGWLNILAGLIAVTEPWAGHVKS